jgi:flagellar FliJ protein
MRMNQTERLLRSREFEVNHSCLRATQIETMIGDFDRICTDLEQQIEAEETRAKISDPKHFAYPTYAKAAQERRTKIKHSSDALRNELDRLRMKANETRHGPDAP